MTPMSTQPKSHKPAFLGAYFRVEGVLVQSKPFVRSTARCAGPLAFADPTLQALYSILFTVTPHRRSHSDYRVTPDEWKHLT